MALLQEEIRNFSFKGWQGILGLANRSTAPDNSTYYEEFYTNDISVDGGSVWLEKNLIPPATNETDAHNNAVNNPTLIEEHGVSNPVHLTPSLNQKGFFATSTFGDMNTRMKNWVMPQHVARVDPGFEGMPSIGYTIRLYQGHPNSGGVEITTTVDQSGADVGWFIMYGAGAIVVSSSFSGITDPNDLWITGYRYIGKTAVDGSVGSLHTYSRQFTDSDLSGGMLTVSHNLNVPNRACNITVMDNTGYSIEVDGVQFTNENTAILDMRSIGSISGAWSVVVTTDTQGVVPPVVNTPERRYINGSAINTTSIN